MNAGMTNAIARLRGSRLSCRTSLRATASRRVSESGASALIRSPLRPHGGPCRRRCPRAKGAPARSRSEEHTSELQSPCNLVCRLLLEKKKTIVYHTASHRKQLLINPTLHAPECPYSSRSQTCKGGLDM